MSSPRLRIAPEPFRPEFGEQGQLRQKVGDSGRVHIDRWLPFLVLNRTDEPETSIARHVAVNSPAYLVWSNNDEADAERSLDALMGSVCERFGTALLITVTDGTWLAPDDKAPSLPPFVFQISHDGGPGARAAADAASRALEAVEIDLRSAQAEVTEMPAPEASPGSPVARLNVTIPQIHRAPDGTAYPQLARELALGCVDALLQAACAYMAERSIDTPPHHRALGRSALLAAAHKADEKLDRIARSFDFLLSISPINSNEAEAQFRSAGESMEPAFRYRPLTVDPDVAKRDLYAIDLSILEDPLLEGLLAAKRRELDFQLTMLANRNTAGFKAASTLVYGAVDAGLLADARSLLEAVAPSAISGETVGAGELAEGARSLTAAYRLRDGDFVPQIEVRDDVSGLLVSGGKLMIARSSATLRRRVDALLAHEVSVHLLTYFNGAAQGLRVFRTGLAGYEGVQEGLGVFAEWCVGGLTAARMRLLAGRVLAVDAMLHGAQFVEVYRMLTGDFAFSRSAAFNITARVYRSGGLAKDAIYLKGFRYVVDRVAAGGSLEPFWLGKISLDQVPVIEELLLRGLLRPPRLLPEFLARPDVQSRIASLAPNTPLHRLLDTE